MHQPSARGLREHTSVAVELLVVGFTLLPYLITAYFYRDLPMRIPLFITLGGDVAAWGEKNPVTAFRVPFMAVLTQIALLLVKYGAVLNFSGAVALAPGQAEVRERLAAPTIRMWDVFRCAAALKVTTATIHWVSTSVEQMRGWSKPAHLATWAVVGVAAAFVLRYALKASTANREMRMRFGRASSEPKIDAARVYQRVLYFNPSDARLFAGKYVFNFAHTWSYVLIGCAAAYLLLAFAPG